MENVLEIENGVVKCLDKEVKSVVIPDGVKVIGKSAFWGCDFLKSVVIPESVTRICKGAFIGCRSISSVEFGGTLAQWEAVHGKLQILYDIPATVVKCSDGEWQKPVVLVEDGVALKCLDERVTNVVIPDGVTEIGGKAFHCCRSLKSVVIVDSVKKIGEEAFWFCFSLSSIVLGEGLEEIGKNAFMCCESLKAISIPFSVRLIDKYAFLGCNAFEKIVSASPLFPFNEKTGKLYDATRKTRKVVLSLGREIAKKEKIVQIQKVSATAVLDSIVSSYNAEADVFSETKKTHVRIKAKNGNVVLLLADSKVKKWMTTLPILLGMAEKGSDAETIRRYAAENALENSDSRYLTVKKNGSVKLKESARPAFLIIPEEVTKIEKHAFFLCDSIKFVMIPPTVTEIGEAAFCNCYYLSEIEFGGTISQWEAVKKGDDWNFYAPATVVKCTDGEAKI